MSEPPVLGPLDRSGLGEARALLEDACRFDAAAQVAEEVLFEPGPGREPEAIAARQGDVLIGLAATCSSWLRIVAVAPDRRGQGVGSALLAAAETRIAAGGNALVRVLDEPGNYLAPGIDLRNRDSITWLLRRGYIERGANTNLLIDVAQNPRVSARRAANLAQECRGYEIRRATPGDAAGLSATIAAEFSAEWAFEVARALAADPAGVHVAMARGQVAAFAAHDGNNRGLGWFGPAGTVPEHRGRGLGKALLIACLVDVARAGHRVCEVAWIGPRDFYHRAATVSGERRFAVLQKELS